MFHSTKPHEAILRKMSQDEHSENPEKSNIIFLLFTMKMRKFLIKGIYYLYISLVALKRADKRFEENVNVDINILSTKALPSNLKIKKLQIKEYY